MQAKTADAGDFLRTDADYLKAIHGCLNEMKAIRNKMRKSDEEIKRSQQRSDKLLEETRSILRNVEKRL